MNSWIWLFVVLRFETTLTAMVISWRLVTHMCSLAFSHQYLHKFLSKATDQIQQREILPQPGLELTTMGS